LGDAYENARVALKKSDGRPMKGSNPAKASKAVGKRKRAADHEEGDAEDEKGPTSPKKTGTATKRAKVEQLSKENAETKPFSGDSEKFQDLAEINGVKPLVVLQDGEETEVGSATR